MNFVKEPLTVALIYAEGQSLTKCPIMRCTARRMFYSQASGPGGPYSSVILFCFWLLLCPLEYFSILSFEAKTCLFLFWLFLNL